MKFQRDIIKIQERYHSFKGQRETSTGSLRRLPLWKTRRTPPSTSMTVTYETMLPMRSLKVNDLSWPHLTLCDVTTFRTRDTDVSACDGKVCINTRVLHLWTHSLKYLSVSEDLIVKSLCNRLCLYHTYTQCMYTHTQTNTRIHRENERDI